jgi:hypothetical protein
MTAVVTAAIAVTASTAETAAIVRAIASDADARTAMLAK